MRNSDFSSETASGSSRHHYGIVLAVALITLGFLPGAADMSSHDESRCRDTALNMIHSGDYLVPFYEGEPRLRKPPLVYWMMAASANVIGENNIAWRVPSIALALLTVLLTVRLATEVAGEEAGMATGLVLATNYEFIKDGRYATFDMPLTFFVCVSAYCFHQWMTRKSAPWVYGAFAAIGLAFLTKGPVGLIFPILAAIVYALVMLARREYDGPRGWQLLHLLPAILLFAAIALPWFFLILQRMPEAWGIWTGELDRGSEDSTHPKPLWYYTTEVLGDALPWTLFLVGALFHFARRRDWLANRKFIFVACWLLAGFFFLHFWVSKRGTYLLPMYPAGAILVGVYLADVFAREPLIRPWEKWFFRVTIGLIGILALIAPWIPLLLSDYYTGDWKLPVSMCLAMGVCTYLGWDALKRFNYRGAFFAVVLAAVFGFSFWNGFLLPMKAADDIESDRQKDHAVIIHHHPRV